MRIVARRSLRPSGSSRALASIDVVTRHRFCVISPALNRRIDLPPLRERADDLAALAVRLLEDISAADGRPARTFTQAALALIGALSWPGNLAELRNAIERAVADTRDDVIQIEHLLPALKLHRAPAPFVPIGNLREARLRFERDYISAVLQHHEWRMAAAAETPEFNVKSTGRHASLAFRSRGCPTDVARKDSHERQHRRLRSCLTLLPHRRART
jgi:hypothetical protein